jgi:hypothetical protein
MYSAPPSPDIFHQQSKKIPNTARKRSTALFRSPTHVGWHQFRMRGAEEFVGIPFGGITPSRNGVILYAPTQRRYYLYFHLHDIMLRHRSLNPSGTPGHAGNTGVNRQKPATAASACEIYEAAKAPVSAQSDEIRILSF